MKWLLAGNVVLAFLVVSEEGWVEWIAVAELVGILALLMLAVRWKEETAEAYRTLAMNAFVALDTQGAYNQRVTEVNAAAVEALAEHSPAQAAYVAEQWMDAYALFTEHAPDVGDEEPTYLDDYR